MPSYNYGQIQTRIADELNRTDLTSQIKLAIVSAVEHYERERWWFEETLVTTVSTVASQNYVSDAVISTLAIIDKIQLTVSGSKYTLFPVPYDEWATEAATSSTSGQPTEYAYYQDRLYLFPTPGSIYALTISGVQRLATLSANGDANGFTNYCEELVRQRAKADLRCNILLDEKAIAEAAQLGANGSTYLSGMERSAYINVTRERDERATTGRLKASGW